MSRKTWRWADVTHPSHRGPAHQGSLGGAIHAELQRFQECIPLPRRAVSFHIGRLLTCIHRHLFSQNLNVKTLKKLCRLRDNNISSRFKCEMGVYLNSYITELRLEAASRLLQRHSLSAAEMASVVGFRNLQTFYRAFKRNFSCTPGVFRSRFHTPSVESPRGERPAPAPMEAR